jgi:predicted nucleic acid-binding protein
MALYDTDVLIWCRRGDLQAARLLQKDPAPCISAQTYMEFLQGSRDTKQLSAARGFMRDMNIEVLPITPNISHRAMALIEEHAMPSGLHVGDALIAATALEHGLLLITANTRHFGPIRGLILHTFKPPDHPGRPQGDKVSEPSPPYGVKRKPRKALGKP